jgi:hypothetical protein
MAGATERRECANRHHGLVEGRRGCLLKPPGEPPQRVPLTAGAVAQRDQGGELERLGQVKLADLPRLDLRDDEVAELERSAESC